MAELRGQRVGVDPACPDIARTVVVEQNVEIQGLRSRRDSEDGESTEECDAAVALILDDREPASSSQASD